MAIDNEPSVTTSNPWPVLSIIEARIARMVRNSPSRVLNGSLRTRETERGWTRFSITTRSHRKARPDALYDGH